MPRVLQFCSRIRSDLPPVRLMDMGFVVIRLVARHRRPRIRSLFIGSHLCSALLSGPASRRVLFHPCASLSLHLHLVVKRTCTSKLSNMLGTQAKSPERITPPGFLRFPGRPVLLAKRNNAECAVPVIIVARGKEQLVGISVRASALSELNGPHVVN